MVFPWGIDVGVDVGVDGTAVAVGNARVGVGISMVATVVGLGTQPFRTITAIVSIARRSVLSEVFMSDLQICPCSLLQARSDRNGRLNWYPGGSYSLYRQTI
jgi:hypothetical protein